MEKYLMIINGCNELSTEDKEFFQDKNTSIELTAVNNVTGDVKLRTSVSSIEWIDGHGEGDTVRVSFHLDMAEKSLVKALRSGSNIELRPRMDYVKGKVHTFAREIKI